MSESVVQIPGWRDISWLRHGFSTRFGGVSTVYEAGPSGHGDLNTGWTAADDPANVAENRRRLVKAVDGGADRFRENCLVTLRQIHSSQSLVVSKSRAEFDAGGGRAALEADGLMTRFPGHLLAVQTADCVPVLVVDLKRRAVAAFHAGWRGTAASIVALGIEQMGAEFGSRPEEMTAAVGPSIGACCYTVGEEVRETFAARFAYADMLFKSDKAARRMYLDLWEANRRQLLGAGISAVKIAVVGECSGCTGLPGRRKYFSHRCENGFTGRMMSMVGVVEDRFRRLKESDDSTE